MHKMEVLIEDIYTIFSIYATVVLSILLRKRRKGSWKKWTGQIRLKFFINKVFLKLENESGFRMSKKYQVFLSHTLNFTQ